MIRSVELGNDSVVVDDFDGGGRHRLPLGKTRSRERRTLAKVARETPEWGLKNEAPARAYSAIERLRRRLKQQ